MTGFNNVTHCYKSNLSFVTSQTNTEVPKNEKKTQFKQKCTGNNNTIQWDA